MRQTIYVKGALCCTLTPQQEQYVLSIKDNYFGDFVFDYVNGAIIFNNTTMESCYGPYYDYVDKPLKKLLKYAKSNGIMINGDIEVSGDIYGEFEKHMVIRIKDSERSDKVAEIINASTEELIEELKDRGILSSDFKYDDKLKRVSTTVYCVMDGETRSDLDHVAFASINKHDAEEFAQKNGFFNYFDKPMIEKLDVETELERDAKSQTPDTYKDVTYKDVDLGEELEGLEIS